MWNYFDSLSDEIQSDISMLVLLTPSEVKKSFANMEFEDPVPSTALRSKRIVMLRPIRATVKCPAVLIPSPPIP